MDKIKISSIEIEKRVRTDMGDIDEMATSIKEHGLIEPIVLTEPSAEGDKPVLIAGERRLRALKKLGWTELTYGSHFKFMKDLTALQRKAIELEENVKRKQLSWQEELTAKRELFDLMQLIHGVPTGGRPKDGEARGFSMRDLSQMLGQSLGKLSEQIQMAKIVQQVPALGAAKNLAHAQRMLKIGTQIISVKKTATQASGSQDWTLYEGDFRNNADNIQANSVDLVWTGLPYGADVQSIPNNQRGAAQFKDSIEDAKSIIPEIVRQTVRVLRKDRYAVFCFGFDIYEDLYWTLEAQAALNIERKPFIWYKPGGWIAQNPLITYGSAYEALLIARKGSPTLLRPNQPNVFTCPPVNPSDRVYTTQKPIPLVEKFLFDMTTEGSTVVDFCAGSGTTGVAALRNKRKAIMFEKDKLACELIKMRMRTLK
jgi:DNA modification methylase